MPSPYVDDLYARPTPVDSAREANVGMLLWLLTDGEVLHSNMEMLTQIYTSILQYHKALQIVRTTQNQTPKSVRPIQALQNPGNPKWQQFNP